MDGFYVLIIVLVIFLLLSYCILMSYNNKINYDKGEKNQRIMNYVTVQDVTVQKIGGHYIVTFDSDNDMLSYQIWNRNDDSMNEDRIAFDINPSTFVSILKNYNSNNDIKFTPTTIIRIGNKAHFLVMTDANVDNSGKTNLIFKKDSISIKNHSKMIDSDLPKGQFNNVIINIDPTSVCPSSYPNGPQYVPSSCGSYYMCTNNNLQAYCIDVITGGARKCGC